MQHGSASNNLRSNFRALIARCALAGALLYLVFFAIGPKSPLYLTLADRLGEHHLLKNYRSIDETFRIAAGGRTLHLSFADFDAMAPDQMLTLAKCYFRAVYGQYPRAVQVGDGRRLINSGPDILEAAATAPPGAPAMLVRATPDGGVVFLPVATTQTSP